jgi:hypothetical protein
MTEPQVPRTSDLMAPAFDALVEGLNDRERAERLWHANHGRLGDIMRGFAGQTAVARAYLTRQIIATRLISENAGQALSELAASEYFSEISLDPQYAVGEMYLFRRKVNDSPLTTGNFLPGVVSAGTKLSRPASVGDFPLSNADFLVTEDCVCSADDTRPPIDQGDGTYDHGQVVLLQLRATTPGPNANTGRNNVIGDTPRGLFDAGQPAAERFQAGAIYSAGGLTEVPDAQLLDLAKAMGTGYFAARTASAIGGVRLDSRVRRVAQVLDYSTAVLRLFCADESWATSLRYRNSVKQGLSERKWVGFGARIDVGEVYNVAVTVRATVYPRTSLLATEKAALTESVRTALTSYFDNRRDFYTWRLTAIGGTIATADPKILTAADPMVIHDGVAVAEPSNVIPDGAVTIPHFSLRGLELAFASPGA